MIQTVNPATGKIIKDYPLMSETEVKTIIAQVQHDYENWHTNNLTERVSQLLKLQTLLKQRYESFAQIITEEMGKPIKAARAEVDKCLLLCEHYATYAEQYLAPREIVAGHQRSYVCYQPIGIIFAIMPWNFPLWQAMRFLVPNLINGNAAILNHAPISTGCALLLEKLVRDAGYPKNLFRVVIVDHETAATIIAHPEIKGVTLTGSEQAGKAVAVEAAKALKKVVLELGGSDPYLILADADVELAAEACVKSRLNNAGQVCNAAKRLIVVPEVREQFQQLVIEKVKAFHMADPRDEDCLLGPTARADLRATVHQQVQQSVAQGAKLICGGEIPQRPGFYYPATILADVKPGMPAFDDEIFGPVIAIINAHDQQHAIELANQVRFGLSAGVFTRNSTKGEQIAREQLQAGTVCVNAAASSHPALPFGGTKSSGFGRELAEEGIREFMNVKTICIK